MLNGKRVAVVLPAYNAATTLERTISEVDRTIVDDLILVDDRSTDQTVELAEGLGLLPARHSTNQGYGANQKTCYRLALERGADIVVMVHPDYQYSPRLVPAMAAMIAYGEYELVLGSRILAQHAVQGGMPRYKYVANRLLTGFQNLVVGAKLSEYHTGLRAYTRDLLEAVRFELNSDDFVFDNQFLAQALMANARIGELSCPTRYGHDSSSINFQRSLRYGLGVVRTSAQFWLHAHGLRRYPYLTPVRALQPWADEVGPRKVARARIRHGDVDTTHLQQ
jgi:glycosyltransferase involved in cell wall biosynthesis